jgi:hypothetical protein
MKGCELDSSSLDYRLVAGSCEQGNETWGSVNCWEIHRLSEQLLLSHEGLCSTELVS